MKDYPELPRVLLGIVGGLIVSRLVYFMAQLMGLDSFGKPFSVIGSVLLGFLFMIKVISSTPNDE